MLDIVAWSVRLAEEVAPDEVELAPAMVQAYLAGGRQRQELFASARSEVGGFIPGVGIVLMPYILQAVNVSGPVLIAALASPFVSNFLDAIGNGLAILQIQGSQKSATSKGRRPVPDEDEYQPLRRLIETMSKELRAAGLEDDQADLITFRTIKAFLDEPESAPEIVKTISARV